MLRKILAKLDLGFSQHSIKLQEPEEQEEPEEPKQTLFKKMKKFSTFLYV